MTGDERPPDTTPLDDLFDILSHGSRRRILFELSTRNPRRQDEFETEDFVTDDDTLELFRIELYHTHLPRLAESGFIDWNSETGTIIRGPRFGEIEPLLTLIHNHHDELPAGWP